MSKGRICSLSEVAHDLDLPQHILSFWETKFSQIKSTRRDDGQRYYRREDIDFLRGIRILLYEYGYTIKGVQEILKTKGSKFVSSLRSDSSKPEDISSYEVEETKSKAVSSEEDLIVGHAKLPMIRRFFQFKEGDNVPISNHSTLDQDARRLLQETIYDLLECKRLLDQVR